MIICYNVPAILASSVEYKYDGRPLSVTKLVIPREKEQSGSTPNTGMLTLLLGPGVVREGTKKKVRR